MVYKIIMNRIIKFFPLLIIFLFQSCATFNAIANVHSVNYFEPELNTEITSIVGDPILSQGTYDEGLGVFIPQDCLDGEVKKGVYFATEIADYIEDNKKLGELYKFEGEGLLTLFKYNRKYETYLVYNTYTKQLGRQDAVTLDIIPDFTMSEDLKRYNGDSLQQKLIYLGKKGDVLKFSYQEFSNNLNKPDFSNEIEYNLTESEIIGYKKARIQVISATNTSITYKVLNYF